MTSMEKVDPMRKIMRMHLVMKASMPSMGHAVHVRPAIANTLTQPHTDGR